MHSFSNTPYDFMGTSDVNVDAQRPRLSGFLELGTALSGKKKKLDFSGTFLGSTVFYHTSVAWHILV